MVSSGNIVWQTKRDVHCMDHLHGGYIISSVPFLFTQGPQGFHVPLIVLPFFTHTAQNLRKDRKEEQEVDAEERSTDGLMTHTACGLEEKKER